MMKKVLFDRHLCPKFITFYGRNLQRFVMSCVFVPGEPFQPSFMFLNNAEAYQSEAPFTCTTLG
jgi:hypothetical protein